MHTTFVYVSSLSFILQFIRSDSITKDGGVHSVMLTKLQEMDAQLTAIENTAMKVEGEFRDSNQVRSYI